MENNYESLYLNLKSLSKQNYNLDIARKKIIECAKAGFLKHGVSRDYGGLGDGFKGLCQAHEDLGFSVLDANVLLGISAHLWGSVFPLLKFGTPEQKELIPKFLDGTYVGGLAITEPDVGSSIGDIKSNATRTKNKDYFVLNGVKKYITNAPIADWILFYAKFNDSMSAFLVNKDDAGARFIENQTIVGFKNAPIGEVILKDCKLEVNRMIGSSSKTLFGNTIVQYGLELERAFLPAGLIGIMKWQLQTAVAHSRNREIGGKTINKFQSISNKIARIRLDLDISKMLMNKCAQLKDQNKRITLLSSESKLFFSEAFLNSSTELVQILGARGLVDNEIYNDYVAAATASKILGGTSEIQQNIISSLSGCYRE